MHEPSGRGVRVSAMWPAHASPTLDTPAAHRRSSVKGDSMDETRGSKVSRRNLLKTTAVAGAAVTAAKLTPAAAAPSIKERFGAKFQSGGEITFALSTGDQQSIQPLLDEYTTTTGTKINTA